MIIKPLFFLNMILSGSEYIVNFFESKQVKHIFGYSGGANLHLLDKISKSNIEFITNRHEQFTGHAAEGYAKSSGKPGIVVTTSGPGVTNLITPLQDAFSDSIPLFVITGQVSSKNIGTNAFQEVDAISLTKPCTKWNYCVQDVNELPQILEKAYIISMDGKKGPVHVDVCSDVFSKLMEYKDTFYKTSFIKGSNKKFDLRKIQNKLINSKKPVVIVGKGAFSAMNQIRNLSKNFHIPVTTTLHAVGLVDERNDFALGMLGMHGTPYANKIVQEADFIIGIGYRFDDRTIGTPETFGMNAKKKFGIIHVDIDSENLNIVQKLVNPSESIKMDSFHFMTQLEINLDMKPKDTLNWVLDKKNKFPLFENDASVQLKMENVIRELGAQLSNTNCIVTTGVGNHQMVTAQHFQWNYPQKLLTSGSLGTMGTGIPFAIGAQFADPSKTVICIDGDGSFLMSLQELGTMKQYNLPIKIIILDNQKLQMVHTWQDLFYEKNHISTELSNPSFRQLGKAFGIKTFTCRSKFSVKNTLKKILNYNGPVLAHFQVVAEHCLPFVIPGNSLENVITSSVNFTSQ